MASPCDWLTFQRLKPPAKAPEVGLLLFACVSAALACSLKWPISSFVSTP